MRIEYTNTNKRKKRKADKLLADRNRVALWHRKFAWRPLKITTLETNLENHSTVIWFEWVMQKAYIRDYKYKSIRKFIWTRHPEKEYFVRKLNGTLESERQFNVGDEAADSA